MHRNNTILLSISAVGLVLTASLVWQLIEHNGKSLEIGDFQIGQNRADVEAKFAGEGIFGRTCFGELAVYGDTFVEGQEHHVMAFIDEVDQTVQAVEVQQWPANVESPAQCEAMVRATAAGFAPEGGWSSKRPAKYSAGATQRYFLRQRGEGEKMFEIWGEHRGAKSFQTCALSWRKSVSARAQLSAEGEWKVPGDASIPFNPLNVAGAASNEPKSGRTN